MLEIWKKQFTLDRFYVHHETPIIFISSQWQQKPGPSLYYLIYRWLVTMFFTISMVLSIVDIRHFEQSAITRAKWLIYLTSWGFATCTLQTMLANVMLSICYLTNTGVQDNKALKLYKLYWITNVTATDVALGVTIIYWSLVHDAKKMPLDAMNVIVHVFNSVLMLADLFIVGHPIRVMHFYWPMLYGICYILFSGVYYSVGGTAKDGNIYIYPILNWSQPGKTTLVCVLVIGFIIFLHFFTFGLYRLRKYIHARLIGSDENKIIGNKKSENNEKQAYNNPALSSDVV